MQTCFACGGPCPDRASDQDTWLGSHDPSSATTVAASDLKVCPLHGKQQYKKAKSSSVRARAMTGSSGSSCKKANMVGFFLGEGFQQISVCA